MIKYDGIKYIDKIPHIQFSNDSDVTVSVPLDVFTANRIIKYLDKIVLCHTQDVEWGNDEPPDAA